jgi:hypothetical protein
VKELWLKALRSGEYKQGRGQLRDANNNFCCLGVLCNIHAQAHPKFAATQTDPEIYDGYKNMISENVCRWAGIENSFDLKQLWARNDAVDLYKAHNFAQMADYIESVL